MSVPLQGQLVDGVRSRCVHPGLILLSVGHHHFTSSAAEIPSPGELKKLYTGMSHESLIEGYASGLNQRINLIAFPGFVCYSAVTWSDSLYFNLVRLLRVPVSQVTQVLLGLLL